MDAPPEEELLEGSIGSVDNTNWHEDASTTILSTLEDPLTRASIVNESTAQDISGQFRDLSLPGNLAINYGEQV